MVKSLLYSITDFNFAYPFSTKYINIKGKLDIYSGDCILLQGNSGSGKSTLLLALKGLIPHLIQGKMNGELLFKGQNISSLSETELLTIGYLQQNPEGQLICEDVFSELAFGLENLGLNSDIIYKKITEFLKRFKLEHLISEKVLTLSGGEKQKINLIALLLLEPDVLLLDEPTAFLDPTSATEVLAILKDYIQNKTAIIIEHNINYLQDVVNRSILVDNDGIIYEQDLNLINWQPKLELMPCKLALIDYTDKLLEIRNLKFAYPTQKILLNNLNLSLYKKQIIAIIGGNGQGKSTLLKLLSKVLKSKNTICYNGKDIAQISKKDYWHEIALLWQNPENHFLHNKVSTELNNNSNLIYKLNLENLTDANPFNLSEGQKRRLSLGTVLQNDAQIFLLDEPTFGQDIDNKNQLAALINQLVLEGKSFIIVSHDLDFIDALTNTVYTLDQGQLLLC